MPTTAPFEWFWVPPTLLSPRERERWPPDPGWPQFGRISEEPDEVQGFLIGRLPITNAQFHLFVKDGGYRGGSHATASWRALHALMVEARVI
jgi:formylglycine-generating enzyme required for sulfatase activity